MTDEYQPRRDWLLPCLLAAAAGAMGWGIRGQFGHETGAMIPGALVSLVIVFCFLPWTSALHGARTAALMTLAISVGGSMTYGQTVGLTHNQALVGNISAYWWGMLGLAIKGGLWIGIGGAFLGLAMSGKRYTPFEMALLFVALVFVMFWGDYLFNEPYDPQQRVLPRIYFSASWEWQPEVADLKPRHERWGGLLLLWIGLTSYARIVKRDKLCARLGLWGLLAGALGFSIGQSLQAYHAWHADSFRDPNSWLHPFDGFNWWNMMETTFGAIWGAILTFGVWTNRHLIAWRDDPPELSVGAELTLAAIHLPMVLWWNLGALTPLDQFAGHGFTMILLPALAVWYGRHWPYWLLLFITLAPIAAKTGLELAAPVHAFLMRAAHITAWGEFELPDGLNVEACGRWAFYVILPLVVGGFASFVLARDDNDTTERFVRRALPLTAWTYFLINHAFFGYPVPWRDEFAGRVPNDVIFFICTVALTLAAVFYQPSHAATESTNDASRSE